MPSEDELKRKVLKLAHKYVSDEEIAKQLGIKPQLVARFREETFHF